MYAPVAVLAATGAVLCFVADAVASTGDWDRVSVVRHQSRRAFIEMADRSDFRQWHEQNSQSVAEAMVLGMKAGLPPQLICDLVRAGAANSRVFELRAPLMVENRYDEPTMKISVWQKDMDVIGGFAKKLGVPTPMFDASKGIYDRALKSGHAAEDTAAVCAVLEKMAGVKRGKPRKAAKAARR